MNKGQAFVSKVLKKKWQQHDLEMHKLKLMQVKPVTDSREPLSLKFPLLKSKQRQLQEDKFTEIERENRLLLEKMTIIMNSDGSIKQYIKKGEKSVNASGIQQIHKSQSILGIDNEESVIDHQGVLSKRSLNKVIRQRHISKINSENRRILERLRQQKSHYNVDKYIADSQRHQQLLKIRSEYPDQYNEMASRRQSAGQRSNRRNESSIRNPIKFRNHTYRSNGQRYQDRKMSLDSERNVNHQGNLTNDLEHYNYQFQTNGNDNQSEFQNYQHVTSEQHGEIYRSNRQQIQGTEVDEMEDLIEQVKSAEIEIPQHYRNGQRIDIRGQGLHENQRAFNSDLKETNKILTPEDTGRMNQTLKNFNVGIHQSGEIVFDEANNRFPSPPLFKENDIGQKQEIQAFKFEVQNQTVNDKQQQSNKTLDNVSSQQVQVIRPLNLRAFDEIEQQRIVLYREDYREIFPPVDAKRQKSGFYVVEISRSKYKFYIIAVKIPKNLVVQVVRGRKNVANLTLNPKAKVYCIDITEKQGRKLVMECESNFKNLVDLLFIKQGKLQIKDFDYLMRFGNPESSMFQVQPNSYRMQHSTNPVIDNSMFKIQPGLNHDSIQSFEQKLKECISVSNREIHYNRPIFQPRDNELLQNAITLDISKRNYQRKNNEVVNRSLDGYERRNINQVMPNKLHSSNLQTVNSLRAGPQTFKRPNLNLRKKQQNLSLNNDSGKWEIIHSPVNVQQNSNIRESRNLGTLRSLRISNNNYDHQSQLNSLSMMSQNDNKGILDSGPNNHHQLQQSSRIDETITQNQRFAKLINSRQEEAHNFKIDTEDDGGGATTNDQFTSFTMISNRNKQSQYRQYYEATKGSPRNQALDPKLKSFTNEQRGSIFY